MKHVNKSFPFYVNKVILLLVIITIFIFCYLLLTKSFTTSIHSLINERTESNTAVVAEDFGESINIIFLQIAGISLGFVLLISFLLIKLYHKNSINEQNLANKVTVKLKTALIELDKNGGIISYNSYAESVFSLNHQKNGTNKRFFDIIYEPDKKVASSMLKKFAEGLTSVSYTLRAVTEGGVNIHMLWSFCTKDDFGNITLLGSNQTESIIFKKRILMSEERYLRSTEAANDIFYELDLKNNTLILWDKFRELTGHSKLDYNMSEYVDNLVFSDDREYVRDFLDKFRSGEKNVSEIEHRLVKNDGTFIWVRVGAALLNNVENDGAYLVGSLTDINENKVRDLRIRQLAYYDMLTQLPNRLSFMESVTKSLKEKSEAVLFYIDIDNFKFVNDNFGHNKGDDLLVTVAKILNEAVSGKNIVARLGGDEFGMFFEDISTEEEAICKAQELLSLFDNVVKNAPLFSRISPSIGIVICPDGGCEYNEVINNADIAMYAAKRVGKRCYKIYEPSMKKEIIELSEMEFYLCSAIENNELYLLYQPIYSNLSKEVVGFEALLRWNSPVYGTVMPGRIVPIAEQSSLMYTIGYWVIEQAALFSKRLYELGRGKLDVSINISMKQFLMSDFVQNVIRIISNTGADPTKIVFEIDQKVMFDNYDTLKSKMVELSNFGIKFSLDDVSSHLKKLVDLLSLPISTIKLDVKISHPNLFEKNDTSLIEPIVRVAKEHSVSIIVESVEDKDLIDKIFISYADRLQGYALGRPMTEESTYKILHVTAQNTASDYHTLKKESI